MYSLGSIFGVTICITMSSTLESSLYVRTYKINFMVIFLMVQDEATIIILRHPLFRTKCCQTYVI